MFGSRYWMEKRKTKENEIRNMFEGYFWYIFVL